MNAIFHTFSPVSHYFEENIVFHDNHLIVAVKPAGMLSQRDQTGDDSILEHVRRFIKECYGKPGEAFIGSVHRLDRPAAGLMIFAKTSKAHTRLNEMFRRGEVQKTYLAISEGIPEHRVGRLVHFLEKDTARNRVQWFLAEGKGRKKAILEYETLGARANLGLLKIRLETGRPHQIRAQLAAIGCPIVGDVKYGAMRKTPDQSICLLSYSLGLIHPVKKEALSFRLTYPADTPFWKEFQSSLADPV